MRSVYRRLLRIRVRHRWYARGESRQDFSLLPTASTRALLAERAMKLHPEPDGLSVVVEVEPDANPAVLFRPWGTETVRLVFELGVSNRDLFNATELPSFDAGRSVFCLDNLSEHETEGRKVLGDSLAGTVFGPPSVLVTRGTFAHRLLQASSRATLVLKDRFGAVVATLPVTLPEPAIDVRLDLSAVRGLPSGRYTLEDDQGGAVRLFYDADLESSRPLAVIELFNRTDALDPNRADRVPPSYRFVSEDTLTGLDAYYVEFAPRTTHWRYLVAKKYATNGIALDKLAILGPVAFSASGDDKLTVFRSAAPVALSETPRALELRHDGKRLQVLPEPSPATPVGREAGTGTPVSDVFVNV